MPELGKLLMSDSSEEIFGPQWRDKVKDAAIKKLNECVGEVFKELHDAAVSGSFNNDGIYEIRITGSKTSLDVEIFTPVSEAEEGDFEDNEFTDPFVSGMETRITIECRESAEE